MATVSKVSSTTSSITVKVSGFSTSYSYTRTVYAQAYLNGTKVSETQQDVSPGSSSTSNMKISGLSSGTEYNIQIYCYLPDQGQTVYLTSADYSTSMPSPSAYFSSITATKNTLTVSVPKDSNYRYVQLSWKKHSSSSYSSSNYYPSSTSYQSKTANWTYEISGLSVDTQYDLRLYVATSSSGANSTLADTDSAWTKADPKVTYVSKTETSITGIVTGLSSNYSYSRTVSLDAYLNGTKVKTASVSIGANVTSSGNITVTGLSSGTTYEIQAWVTLYDGSNVYIGSFTETTDSPTPTVTPWSWTSANSTVNPSHTAEATAAQTTAARNACQNKTAVSNFKYQVWNDLVYKVSEARVASGHSEWNTNNGTYATRTNTLMTSSSKTLTALRYNSMRYNLGELYSTGISDVTSGVTRVNGTTHFINFVTKLNEFINQYR